MERLDLDPDPGVRRLCPGHCGRREWRLRNGVKALLYGALFVYPLLWGLDGSWLDFYDALLWILCFFAVELNIFAIEAPQGESATATAAEAPASTD